MYAEKLKDNQTKDFRVFYFKRKLRKKLMTHLTGFNYTEFNRCYVVYPETLEIEGLFHKHVQLQKMFDSVIKCNGEEKVFLKSLKISLKEVTTI